MAKPRDIGNHREINCPVCKLSVCKLDGSREGFTFQGLEVEAYRAEDGTLVVAVDGPGDDDCDELGTPSIRIWLNDALIYRKGEVGDDLSVEPD